MIETSFYYCALKSLFKYCVQHQSKLEPVCGTCVIEDMVDGSDITQPCTENVPSKEDVALRETQDF